MATHNDWSFDLKTSPPFKPSSFKPGIEQKPISSSPFISKRHLNLIICGEIELNNPSTIPVAVQVKDPSKTTVSDLKAMASSKTGIPKEELILHFSDSILPDDTPLSQWKEMRSGATVLARTNPLIVTLQRYNSDVEVKFEIPRQFIDKLPTKSFFDLCLYKGGLPYRKNGKYVFAVEGTIMKEEGKKMSEYQWFERDVTISVTYITKVVAKIASNLGSFHVPYFLSSYAEMNYERPQITTPLQGIQSLLPIQNEKNEFQHPWSLKVQKLDGITQTIAIRRHYRTPIYKLKQLISPDTNIRLTIGTTVLEDWDDEGNMMLLCSYPDLHDGATLCQISLTGAMRIKWVRLDRDNKKKKLETKKIRLHDYQNLVEGHHEAIPPAVIIVDIPNHFTVRKLTAIFDNIGARKQWPRQLKESIYEVKVTSENKYCTGRKLPESDDVISSIDYIYDGCTLAIEPIYYT